MVILTTAEEEWESLFQTNAGIHYANCILILCTQFVVFFVLCYASCVYVHSLEKHESAVQVCAVGALNLAQQVANRDPQLRERGSRLLLILAKWLQQENHLVSSETDSDRSAMGRLLAWEKAHNTVNDLSIFGIVEVQSKYYL